MTACRARVGPRPGPAAGACSCASKLTTGLEPSKPAELLAYLPIVERPAARRIRYDAPDIPAAVRFLTFIASCAPDIQP
jgi:D-aminopeptidase